MGIPAKARDQYYKVIELDPEFSQAYNNLGNVSGQLGQLDSAIWAFTTAIGLDQSFAGAHYNLGQAFILKREFAKAETELLTASELVPTEPKYSLALGLLYSSWKKYPEAVRCLEKTIASDHENTQAYYQLAMAYKEMKHYDEAVQALKKHLALITDIQERNIINIKIRDIRMLQAREKLANSRKGSPVNP